MLSALDQCTKNNRPRKGCRENVRTVEGRDMSANEACYFMRTLDRYTDGCASRKKGACNGCGFGWPVVARIMIIIRWREVVVSC